MGANTFGERFCVTTFGESHGPALGCVIDGMPANVPFNSELLKKNLERRRPGQSHLVTGRNENDEFEILSGVFENKTLGTPIAVMVRNQDQRSQDYDAIKLASRAGHADDVWKIKFGHTDHRGGGRSSGRETLSRVIAGSFAQMLVTGLQPQIKISTFASAIGPYSLSSEEMISALNIDAYSMPTRFPSAQAPEVEKLLQEAKVQGESYGGRATLVIQNPGTSLGQPVFHKLKSDLAMAVMSVGATNGVEFGAGFQSQSIKGTQFHRQSQEVYGGLRGGLSTGESIVMHVSVKPTSSILDTAKAGRHDPCILIRALQVFESMVWLTLADHYLWKRTDQ